MQEILHSQRLELHRIGREHAQEIFDSYASDPEVSHYLSWPAHQSIADTHEFIDMVRPKWGAGQDFTFVIRLQETRQVIGCINAMVNKCRAHIGYVTAKAYWNQGITTEALARLIPEVFAMSQIARIEAICDTENIGSARVMEHVGMQREGTLRHYFQGANLPEARDVYMYALLQEEWKLTNSHG